MKTADLMKTAQAAYVAPGNAELQAQTEAEEEVLRCQQCGSQGEDEQDAAAQPGGAVSERKVC